MEFDIASIGRALLFLGIPAIFLVFWAQWRWASVCANNVQVLVMKADGHGDYELAPQEGGSVTLRNPSSGTARLWPINELSTIDVPYPGVGFVPGFMQKNIRMVIVDEKDWEPVINRGPHRERVASPDVVESIKQLGEENPELLPQINILLAGISTSSTREMIASPAVLGNLMNEKITEAVITVNKEMIDSVSGLMKKIGDIVRPLHLYIVGGVIIAVQIYIIFQLNSLNLGDLSTLVDKINAIGVALGVQ